MIKLLSVSLLSLVLLSNVFAVDDRNYKDNRKTSIAKQSTIMNDTNNKDVKGVTNKISSAITSANLPGTKVGDTAYNYQTNGVLHDRIIAGLNGTLHAQWMYSDIAEVPASPDRRMYYNYFDGTGWIHNDVGLPIENERAGYGSLAVDGNNIAIGTSHHTPANEEACNVWSDYLSGFGYFSKSTVWAMRDHGSLLVQASWPDVVVDDQDIWHVIACNYSDADEIAILNDVHFNTLYWRSTDRGESWSDYYALFADSSTYPLLSTADEPRSSGNDYTIAVSDIDDGRMGILLANMSNTVYLFESNDRGETWEEPVNIPGYYYYQEKDSLLNPFIWDIYMVDSTMYGGDIDTFIILFSYETVGDEREGVCDFAQRPMGASDLQYINGEPHAVWSEAVTKAAGSYYPAGHTYWWTTKGIHLMNGDTLRQEGGFAIKHWSPSTGVTTIIQKDEQIHSYSGSNQSYLTCPQLGVSADGSIYCVFTKYSDSDTLEMDGQVKTNWGPLSFGRIWGAKSDDGGATWYDPGQLIPEEDCIRQNLRYVAVNDVNDNDYIHVLYQNTSDIPGTAVGGTNGDHDTWATADMMHWPIPVSLFPTTKDYFHGPELELVISSTEGGLNFGYIGDAGSSKLSITVKNVGDRDLVVGDLFTSHRSFKASPVNFTVAPGASQEVEVTFQPTIPDTFFAYLAIPNNDFTEASAGIPLEGSGIPSGVANMNDVQPVTYSLEQNYPNPFNPVTNIKFTIQKSSTVKLIVYNTLGEEIDVLVNKHVQAGSHQITWTPENVSSGVYFYRLSTGDFSDIRKMILMK